LAWIEPCQPAKRFVRVYRQIWASFPLRMSEDAITFSF
jgi:hypothetical protein